jgi:antitoxin (DNA-binding transcriptional repressor) of toxin-antitoxin stability system
VATGGYHGVMQIGVKEAKSQLSEILRRVEAGETVTITRDGVPVADIKKHEPKQGGVNWEALRQFLDKHRIKGKKTWVSPDFDDPLPEDFLITENAEEKYLAEQAMRRKAK